MKITWIDDKSVLRLDKKFYKAGDEIPAEGLSKTRIDLLKSQKKIRIGDEKKETVTGEVFGMPVESVVTGKIEDEKPKRGRKREEVGDDDSSEG